MFIWFFFFFLWEVLVLNWQTTGVVCIYVRSLLVAFWVIHFQLMLKHFAQTHNYFLKKGFVYTSSKLSFCFYNSDPAWIIHHFKRATVADCLMLTFIQDCFEESEIVGLPEIHGQISVWQVSVAQSDACSTGGQEVVSSRLQSGPLLSLRLIMKSFLLSFSPFRWFKKGGCQLLAKECSLSTG